MTNFIEFAARGKNTWWRYAASLIAAGLATVALFTAATLCLSLLHLVSRNFAAELTRPADARPFFVGVAMIFGALLAGSTGAFALIQHKTFGDLVGRWRWSAFVWGVVVWGAVQAGITLVDFLIAPHGFRLTLGRGTGVLAVSALVALPIQSFAEEFVFRGWLTQGLLLLFRQPIPTALVSGAIFGTLHIWNGVPQGVEAFISGTIYSLIAIRTAGLALPVGLHLANNYFGAVIAVSAGDVFKGCPGFLLQNTPQLVWSDVGLMAAALILILTVAPPAQSGEASRRLTAC